MLNFQISAAREIGEANRDIVAGFICQTKISDFDDMGHWTPGWLGILLIKLRIFRLNGKESINSSTAIFQIYLIPISNM